MLDLGLRQGGSKHGEVVDQTVHVVDNPGIGTATLGAQPDAGKVRGKGVGVGGGGPLQEKLPIDPDLLGPDILDEGPVMPKIRPPGVARVGREVGDGVANATGIGSVTSGIKINNVVAPRRMGLETALTGLTRGRVSPERRAVGVVVLFDPKGERHDIICRRRVDEAGVRDQDRSCRASRAKVDGVVAGLRSVPAPVRREGGGAEDTGKVTVEFVESHRWNRKARFASFRHG